MKRVLQSWLARASIAATLGVAGAAFAAASAPPALAPPAWPANVGAAVTAPTDPVRPLLLGKLRVVLESTDLSTLRSAIGAGVVHQGAGSDTLSFLCYTIPDPVTPQRVWFTSSEAARKNAIDGIVAAEIASGAPAEPQCPELAAKFQPLRFDDGLWLGALSAEQKRAFAPAIQKGTPWNSSFHEKRGNLDVIGSMAIDIRKGRAVGIYVLHATQN